MGRSSRAHAVKGRVCKDSLYRDATWARPGHAIGREVNVRDHFQAVRVAGAGKERGRVL